MVVNDCLSKVLLSDGIHMLHILQSIRKGAFLFVRKVIHYLVVPFCLMLGTEFAVRLIGVEGFKFRAKSGVSLDFLLLR
jgi:hypothetical protein